MNIKKISLFLIVIGLFVGGSTPAEAIPFPSLQLGMDDIDDPGDVSSTLQILFLLTVLTLAPSILIMTTSLCTDHYRFVFSTAGDGNPANPANTDSDWTGPVPDTFCHGADLGRNQPKCPATLFE